VQLGSAISLPVENSFDRVGVGRRLLFPDTVALAGLNLSLDAGISCGDSEPVQFDTGPGHVVFSETFASMSFFASGREGMSLQ
jgi:hypothetical protein